MFDPSSQDEAKGSLLEEVLSLRDLAVRIALTGGTCVRAMPRRLHSRHPSLEDLLCGRTVLITDASGDIGQAVARKTADAGATVVLVARSEEKLRALAVEIEDWGGRARVYAADLSSGPSTDVLLARLARDRIDVDVLVNNAGRTIRRPVSDSSARIHDYERTMALNYFGAVRLILGLLGPMRARKRGHVINVSSAGVQTGTPLFSAYVASKAALDAFTRVVAAETRGEGVCFTTVHMPLVRMPMIVPTAVHERVPALTPEEAADIVLRAVVTEESHLGTWLGSAFSVGHLILPDLVGSFLAWGHGILARRERDAEDRSPRHWSPVPPVPLTFGRSNANVGVLLEPPS